MTRTAAAIIAAMVAACIVITVAEAFTIVGFRTNFGNGPRSSGSDAPGTTAIGCQPVEQLATHYHVALRIHEHGQVNVLPAGTGIEMTCIYWIHVHDNSGIVHIEAPASYSDHVFVLGDAFAVAGRRLDAHDLGSDRYSDGSVAVYDDGVAWSGAPGSAPLTEAHTLDVVAPGESFNYQPFDWPPGFISPSS